jgi:hypothetical protein
MQFNSIDLGTAPGGCSAVADLLPVGPAVYAFVRTIDALPTHDAESFVAAVTKLVETRSAPDHQSAIGPLHRVALFSSSRLSMTKQEALVRLAQSPEFRVSTAEILRKASTLQAPLYVGKTISLQDRFLQHTNPMSQLSKRLRESGLSLDECTFVFVPLEPSPDLDDEDALLLVEELLTRLLRPGFVLRIG